MYETIEERGIRNFNHACAKSVCNSSDYFQFQLFYYIIIIYVYLFI